jgi:hypothetical protein
MTTETTTTDPLGLPMVMGYPLTYILVALVLIYILFIHKKKKA